MSSLSIFKAAARLSSVLFSSPRYLFISSFMVFTPFGSWFFVPPVIIIIALFNRVFNRQSSQIYTVKLVYFGTVKPFRLVI